MPSIRAHGSAHTGAGPSWHLAPRAAETKDVSHAEVSFHEDQSTGGHERRAVLGVRAGNQGRPGSRDRALGDLTSEMRRRANLPDMQAADHAQSEPGLARRPARTRAMRGSVIRGDAEDRLRRSRYPFTLPAVRPSTMYFCR